jgi:hypothetical protein
MDRWPFRNCRLPHTPCRSLNTFLSPDAKYSDLRQHAVALVYVVPVTGTCDPRQDALEMTWMTPAEAVSESVLSELEGGRGSLLRAALASVGALP